METVDGCRHRVYAFEKEIKTNLLQMTHLENDIKKLSKLRSQWLDCVSRNDDFEVKTVTKRLELLRIRADTYQTELQMDSIRLEGFYEAMQLSHMVLATGPVDSEESLAQRQAQLAKHSRESVDELKQALRESIDYRIKLGFLTDAVTRELKSTLSFYENRQTVVVEELRIKILSYIEELKKSREISKQHFKAITADYLVLRHNARVAKEVLVRKQNESQVEREELQRHMEQMMVDADMQRQRMEANANDELRILTNDVRSELMKNESELRIAIKEESVRQEKKKQTNNRLKKEIKRYQYQYDHFENTKKVEIRSVLDEIENLRALMHDIKRQYVDWQVGKRDRIVPGRMNGYGCDYGESDEVSFDYEQIHRDVENLNNASLLARTTLAGSRHGGMNTGSGPLRDRNFHDGPDTHSVLDDVTC